MTRWAQIGTTNYFVSDDGQVSGASGLLRQRILNKRLVVTMKNKCVVSVHRLVAKAFIDNPQNHPIVWHLDGNFLNCHFTNLAWGRKKNSPCICTVCRKEKDISEFPMINKKRVLSTGEVHRYKLRRYKCKKCYNRKQYIRKKLNMITKTFSNAVHRQL